MEKCIRRKHLKRIVSRTDQIMNGYRKELKYIVGDDVFLDVKNRISHLMRADEHQNGGFYRIRSVYFDSINMDCYRENLAGVSTREKYRIRTYNCSRDVIMAEIKIRHADTISKMSTKIGPDLLCDLLGTDHARRQWALMKALGDSPGDRVLEKYMLRVTNEMYSPVVIVDYERSAFVYDICNVRITFDRNVCASRDFTRLFDKTPMRRAAIENNRHILEIKYDEFLPGEIEEALGGLSLIRCCSSKYAMCVEASSP